MSLLFRRPESRAISREAFLSDSDWSGGMSQDKALSAVPVFAAVKKISDTISTLPIHSHLRRADGSRQPIPNPVAIPTDGTRVPWVKRLMTSVLLRGNAWGVLGGLQRGWPTSVVWVSPDRVRVDDSQGRFYLDNIETDPDRLLHIPAFVVPGRTEGLSPIRYFAETFDAGLQAQRASRDWSVNRAVPGVWMQKKDRAITPAEADTLAARARQKIRTGEPFVTGSDWALDVLSIPAGDAAFLQSIKAGATQVAAIFDIPPEMIGGESGGSLTYNTVELQATHFLTYTIRPWLVLLEDVLSAKLMPRGQSLRFSMDAMIRPDTATRYGTYRTAREIGLLSIDEIRELEDRQPLPGGEGQEFAPLPMMPKPTTTEGKP